MKRSARTGPPPEAADAMRALEPEQRLAAAVLRQAVLDMGDAKRPEATRCQARAFLAGAGTFPHWCAMVAAEPAKLARKISRLARAS